MALSLSTALMAGVRVTVYCSDGLGSHVTSLCSCGRWLYYHRSVFTDTPLMVFQVQRCFTSTETVLRAEPRTVTSTFTQLRGDGGWLSVALRPQKPQAY